MQLSRVWEFILIKGHNKNLKNNLPNQVNNIPLIEWRDAKRVLRKGNTNMMKHLSMIKGAEHINGQDYVKTN